MARLRIDRVRETHQCQKGATAPTSEMGTSVKAPEAGKAPVLADAWPLVRLLGVLVQIAEGGKAADDRLGPASAMEDEQALVDETAANTA